MICLIVMTDGRRDCIEQAIPSLDHLNGPITRRIVHDDSGDDSYRRWLETEFPNFDIIHHPEGRQGFGGAYRNAWLHLTGLSQMGITERFVFSTEDDFVLTRAVDLVAMADVLDENPCLMQLALRRQPWNDEERAAGGVVESHPGDYQEMLDQGHRRWLEHRRFFTTNPSLFRTDLCRGGWPNVQHSEGVFTHQLLADPAVRFGFWGSRDSGEWCEHIGRERVGTGY